MKKYLFFLVLAFASQITSANDCKEIKPFTKFPPNPINEATSRLMELHQYDNPHITLRHYQRPITRQQQQRYMGDILDSVPIGQIHPIVFRSAIGRCDYESMNRYLDHGFSFACYTQEGSSNFLNHFARCVFAEKQERNATLKRVLQAGINPNEGIKDLVPDAAGIYPLSNASEGCDETMIDLLLEYQANPNQKTRGETYFPVFNVCTNSRSASNTDVVSDFIKYSPTSTLPMGHIMASLLAHGADPNTIYLSNDTRNFATEARDKVLARACSGQDKHAKSLYDFYARELEKAQYGGDPIKINNFRQLFDVLVDRGAQPLAVLCQQRREN
ncbi:MAG: hypothetical protein KDI15_00110 [Thiothrix sp.]|nr:hypothetical protein [Thiothrix sp.]HPE59733.1 hypothetical protein [Thiolinea sp.]